MARLSPVPATTVIKLLLTGGLVLLVLGACAPVAPYQRGRLAHPAMNRDSRPEEQRAHGHMIGARESTQGATGEAGGGCGCN